MLDKKVTRKEFLLSALSVVALFAVSKVPKAVTSLASKKVSKEGNVYGNYTYGGGTKNHA